MWIPPQCRNCPHGWLACKAIDQLHTSITLNTHWHLVAIARSHWFTGTRRNLSEDKSRFRSGKSDCNNCVYVCVFSSCVCNKSMCMCVCFRCIENLFLIWRIVDGRDVFLSCRFCFLFTDTPQDYYFLFLNTAELYLLTQTHHHLVFDRYFIKLIMNT